MSLATLIQGLLLISVGGLGLRRRRHWLFVLAVVAGVVGSFISVGQFAVTGNVFWYSIWDLPLAPVSLWVVAAYVALRARSPVVDFDRELYHCLVELGDILDRSRFRQDPASIQAWIDQASDRGARLHAKLQRLNPPTRAWAELLARYVELTQDTVAAIPTGVNSQERTRLAARGDELAIRYEELRKGEYPERKPPER